MRLEQLYYLIEIAKTGSISPTAERIYVSQPTITEAIKKLEQELGVTLLTRSHLGVSLTKAGEKVVESSKQALEILDNLKTEFKLNSEKENAEITGNLSIFASPEITQAILPKVLEIFYKRYPNVNSMVYQADIFNIVEGIQAKSADLGIISMAESIMGKEIYKIDNENIYFEKLFFYQVYALVSSNSPLASRASISMVELMKYPLAFFSINPLIKCWIECIRDYGNPNIYIRTSSFEVYANAINKDQAIGFIPDFYFNYAKHKYTNIVPITIKENLTGVVGWLRLNKNEFLPVTNQFVNILKSQC